MEPPECAVCDEVVAADVDRLRFRDRWWCEEHLEAARARPDDTDVDDLALSLRWGLDVRLHRSDPRVGVTLAYAACAPSTVADVAAALRLVLPELLGAPIGLTETGRRTYSPGYGETAPNCPFSDHVRWEGATDGHRVAIESVWNRWNAEELSNASASLTIWSIPDDELWVSVSGSAGADGLVTELRCPAPFRPERIRALRHTVGVLHP